MNLLYEVLRFTSISSPLVGIVLYYYFNTKPNKGIPSLVLFMQFSLTCDLLGEILAKTQGANLIILNIYFIVQLLLATILYIQIMPIRIRLMRILVYTFFAIIIINGAILQDLNEIQNINWTFSTLFVMIMAFAHFVQMTKNPVIQIRTYPYFWITIGMFFYCSLSLILLMLSRYFAKHHTLDDFQFLWVFHNVNNIFKNMCFAAAVWWLEKRDVSWFIGNQTDVDEE